MGTAPGNRSLSPFIIDATNVEARVANTIFPEATLTRLPSAVAVSRSISCNDSRLGNPSRDPIESRMVDPGFGRELLLIDLCRL